MSVARIQAAATVGEARAQLALGSHDGATDVAVCEGERLVGLVPVARLLGADAASPLAPLVDHDPVVVGPADGLELASVRAAHRGARSVAVVDEDGRLQELLPPERLLAVMLTEHERDLARLGGVLSGTSAARSASEEGVRRRLWHRLPWLVLGLAGAMASTVVVASFEEQLRREVLLAAFLPAVVYMADAVGTQTETLVIRGLSVGVPIRTIVRKELATGAAIGVLVAAAFYAFAMLAWGDAGIAATVSVSLLASASVATLVAMALPFLLDRLGRDPAFGSGPLATVVQDLLSIVIYLALALAFAV